MRRILSLAALSLVAFASTATAQRVNPSPEFGVDGGLMLTLNSPTTTAFSLPIQSIRAGFFLSPEMSLEPSFSLNTISRSGNSITDYSLGLGLLYHLSTNRAANQMYLRPFVAFDGTSVSGGGSSSGFTVGGGFGIKVPLNARFTTRYEANIAHASSSGVSQNGIGLLAGLSMYTR